MKTTKPKAKRTKTVALMIYTSSEITGAVADYLASLPKDERPTKTSIVEAGVCLYLQGKGFWPTKGKK